MESIQNRNTAMRNSKYILYILSGLVMGHMLNSCSKEKDYSAITYRNYLRYEINQSEAFLSSQVEGTGEGQYKPGSIQEYQDVIDLANSVCEDSTSIQTEIDLTYKNLLQAGEDFFDMMVPFKSDFEELINDAEFTLNHTEEGNLEGNVKSGSKEELQKAIDQSKLTLNRSDLTQRMIDSDQVMLINAMYEFDSNIIGEANLYLENNSFESPGFNTTNFTEVPGWSLYGKLETWAPKAEIYEGGTALLPLENVPDGEFVIKLGSYTQGIYQPLQERIHPNVTYKLNFKASLLENNPDAYDVMHKVIILSRLILFEKEPGDYRFSQVISESYDTLGMDPSGFVEIKHEIDFGATSEFLEKKFSIDFMVKHTFDTANPIWAESYVAVDNIIITRKQN
jgi:hypothetical protein